MQTYIVMPGDTINSIAQKFNVDVISLVRENNLENIYYLVPGLELIIPISNNNNSTNNANGNTMNTTTNSSNNGAFEYYTVKKGDNLYAIAKKYNISDKTLAEINGLELNEYIYPDQTLLIPKAGVGIYITKDDDTLKKITEDLQVPVNEILYYNQNIYLLPEQLIVYPKNNQKRTSL